MLFLPPNQRRQSTEGISIMLEIVSEIGMEQTQLFQCTLQFHYVDRLTVFVIEIVIDFQIEQCSF